MPEAPILLILLAKAIPPKLDLADATRDFSIAASRTWVAVLLYRRPRITRNLALTSGQTSSISWLEILQIKAHAPGSFGTLPSWKHSRQSSKNAPRAARLSSRKDREFRQLGISHGQDQSFGPVRAIQPVLFGLLGKVNARRRIHSLSALRRRGLLGEWFEFPAGSATLLPGSYPDNDTLSQRRSNFKPCAPEAARRKEKPRVVSLRDPGGRLRRSRPPGSGATLLSR